MNKFAVQGIGYNLVLTTLGDAGTGGAGDLVPSGPSPAGRGSPGPDPEPWVGFQGALIAILLPGAFIDLGPLIALKNLMDQRARRRVPCGVRVRAPAATGTSGESRLGDSLSPAPDTTPLMLRGAPLAQPRPSEAKTRVCGLTTGGPSLRCGIREQHDEATTPAALFHTAPWRGPT